MEPLPPSVTTASEQAPAAGPWYSELNRYHWFVLIVAALGWLFDTMDQQIFNLARLPAMQALLSVAGRTADPTLVDLWSARATTWFLLGWATGGLLFGYLGDLWGRAKVMLWTILIYSLCTGLSALSWDPLSFVWFRFLTGLGVGGEFAVGVALVAEVMPNRARPFALGLLQALSAVGNIAAGIIGLVFTELEHGQVIKSAWQGMFVVGALPALLALFIRRRLKEPERWKAAASGARSSGGTYAELFGNPRWAKNAVVGLLLAVAGVVSLWGIVFYSVDLQRLVFTRTIVERLRSGADQAFPTRQDEHDRSFILAMVQRPPVVEASVTGTNAPVLSPWEIPARNLIGPAETPRLAETIWAAAQELHRAGKPVSTSSVLETLQQKAAAPKKPGAAAGPTPPEELQTWERYLNGSSPAAISGGSTTPEAATAEGTAAAADPLAAAEKIRARARNMQRELGFWSSLSLIAINIGGFFGMNAFSYFTYFAGRKPAFLLAFMFAAAATILVFWKFDDPSDVFWMLPLMGFFQLAIFGGYAIYFPELFPTRLRSTGTSFCYNVGRFIAATGPLFLNYFKTHVFGDYPEPMRYAGIAMCSVYLIGIFALPFAEETRGHDLPE